MRPSLAWSRLCAVFTLRRHEPYDMRPSSPLPDTRKLSFTYRVEPGCLGPDGDNLVDDFCRFAQRGVNDIEADYLLWELLPRRDKSLPEMQYSVQGKTLNSQQARKYLALFEKDLDDFELAMGLQIAQLIDQYMQH